MIGVEPGREELELSGVGFGFWERDLVGFEVAANLGVVNNEWTGEAFFSFENNEDWIAAVFCKIQGGFDI
jgi:hypothetical protein